MAKTFEEMMDMWGMGHVGDLLKGIKAKPRVSRKAPNLDPPDFSLPGFQKTARDEYGDPQVAERESFSSVGEEFAIEIAARRELARRLHLSRRALDHERSIYALGYLEALLAVHEGMATSSSLKEVVGSLINFWGTRLVQWARGTSYGADSYGSRPAAGPLLRTKGRAEHNRDA